MLISIDYDDTYSAAPEAWAAVCLALKAHGHRVICISARRDTFANRSELAENLPQYVPAYCSYDQPKREFAEERGLHVDVWIDDMPEAVTMVCAQCRNVKTKETAGA